MYSIVNSISERALPPETNAPKGCQITKVATGALITLGIGAAAFSSIFFTTHLLIPSLATSISLVVLLGGVDISIQICCKYRSSDPVPVIDLLGNPPPPPERDNAGNMPNLQPPVVEVIQEQQVSQIPIPVGDSNANNQGQLQVQQDGQGIAVIPQEAEKPSPEIPTTEGSKFAAIVFATKGLTNEIYKFLSVKDICKLELVCKQWKVWIGNDYNLWKMLGARVGYDCLGYEGIYKRKVHLLEVTKSLKNVPLTVEELELNVEFLSKRENDFVDAHYINFANTAYLTKKRKIWNNYYIEQKNSDTILIKNLKDSRICIEIQNPCIKNTFDYFLMNGFLIIVAFSPTADVRKRYLNVWNLQDGSHIEMPKIVKRNFHRTTHAQPRVFEPYIYKDLLVPFNFSESWNEGFITIYNLTTGKPRFIDNIVRDLDTGYVDFSRSQFHHILAFCEEKMLVCSTFHAIGQSHFKISVINLETNEWALIKEIIITNGSPVEYRNFALSKKYIVIASTREIMKGSYQSNFYIYKESKDPNKKYSKKKSFQIPELMEQMSIVGNYLIGIGSEGKIIILNMSLPKEVIWEQRKEYRYLKSSEINKLNICDWDGKVIPRTITYF